MTNGYIDSASFHGVILALRDGKPESWQPWVWDTVHSVTCALWSQPSFSISPDPSPHHGARGEYDHLLTEFSVLFSGIAHQDSRALQRTRQWARRNTQKVRLLHQQLGSNPSFAQWLDWYIDYFWPNHCQMHDGLFTPEFIPVLSRIMDCDEQDLAKVHGHSRNLPQVESWAQHRPNTEDFALVLQAFVLSTLLRGRYHDYAAEHAGVQIYHHPMRQSILTPKSPTALFTVPNSAWYLTNIILRGALVEKRVPNRVALWAGNILKVRRAEKVGLIDLRHKDSDAAARQAAFQAARRAGIRLHRRAFESFLEILGCGGVAALSAYALSPWISVPLAIGAHVVSRKLRVAERVARSIHLTEGRLQDLGTAPPGRVERATRCE